MKNESKKEFSNLICQKEIIYFMIVMSAREVITFIRTHSENYADYGIYS